MHSFSQGAAKEAGKETVKYIAQNPDTTQQLNDAEAKAQQGYEDAKTQAQVCHRILFCCLLFAHRDWIVLSLLRACGQNIAGASARWLEDWILVGLNVVIYGVKL